MILCSFKNLSLSFGPKVLFKNAELLIEESDRIGLLGLNGKGKSSLFKILEGKQGADTSTPPFTFDKTHGFSLFHVPQEIPADVSLSTTIQNCFWEFYPQYRDAHFELEEINAHIEKGNASDKDLNRQAKLLEEMDQADVWNLLHGFESYCKSLGLEDLTAALKDLSGGQKKKVLLALGLSAKDKLILWDEPTNHLDIETIKAFEEELLITDQAYILVTHDRYLLGKVTNKIFQIKNEQIISFKGGYRDYLELEAQREQDRLSQLNKLQNSFRREDAWMKQGIKARGTRSKKRVEGFHDVKKKISDLKGQAKRNLMLQVAEGNKKSKQLIDVKDLSFSYPGKDIFQHLNFSIYRGNKIGILGDNGVGKSTLIKILSGEIKDFSGTIKSAPEIVVKVFTQQRDELPLDKSPFEILGDGSDQVGLPNGGTQHVISYFKKFLFNGDEIHRPLRTFSGGERNRLQLALNLKDAADVWVFDEPTNDLDLETLDILEKTLEEFKGCILVISHDRSFLKNVTNRLLLIENQQLEIFEGGYEQAEEYLEVKALEDQLNRDSVQDSFKDEEVITSIDKITKKSSEPKMNPTQLEIKIQETEQLIDKIDALMNELSIHQESAEGLQKLAQLSDKKNEKEELLLELYEQLES